MSIHSEGSTAAERLQARAPPAPAGVESPHGPPPSARAVSSDRTNLDSLLRQALEDEVAEQRRAERFPLQLRVAVVYHQHEDAATRPRYHGKTCDICMDGLSVLVEDNIFHEGEVTLLLALPPAQQGVPQKIIEATAKMMYTVLSSQYDAFRVGLVFRGFKHNGRELLEAAINARFPPYEGEDG